MRSPKKCNNKILKTFQYNLKTASQPYNPSLLGGGDIDLPCFLGIKLKWDKHMEQSVRLGRKVNYPIHHSRSKSLDS